jgi:hypothetical protein
MNADFADEIWWIHTHLMLSVRQRVHGNVLLQITGSNSKELVSGEENKSWWNVWSNKKLTYGIQYCKFG